MTKNACTPALEMPEAPTLDPFTRWFGVQYVDLSPSRVDPIVGRPYLGARFTPMPPPAPAVVEEEEEGAGATGEAAVALWTWMMGPPPRCA